MKFIPGDGTKFAIQTSFDAQPNIDSAQALRSNGMVHGAMGPDARHVARIDKRLIHHLCVQEGIKWEDREAVRDMIDRKLQDGTLSQLRVWEGKF